MAMMWKADTVQTLLDDGIELSDFVRQFAEAVQNGDTEFLKKHVKRKKVTTLLNSVQCGKLLLHAITNNNADTVDLLLNLQPHLRINDSSNSLTPLWTALIYSHVDIIKMIVRARADLHKRIGRNVLYDPEASVIHVLTSMSFNSQRKDLLDMMLEYGANVNALDSKGKTPLHYAVEIDDTELASTLISRGAEVNAVDKSGISPFLLACKVIETEDMIMLLIKHGADVHARCNEGLNAIHFLAKAKTECLPAVELLLKHDIPLYGLDQARFFTPLHFAVQTGKEYMTKIFIERGADVNASWGCRPFPLYLAAAGNSVPIIELLITKGADIEKKTRAGRTALHNACKNLRDKNITVLIEYGADVNAVDEENSTPFSLIEFKNLSMATKAMIRVFAKLTATNKPMNSTDLAEIKEYPNLQAFYESCLNEINRMKSLKLFNDFSYFSMFSKNQIKLALLLRDPKFVFPVKIENLDELFPLYCRDFNRALDRAQLLHNDLCCIENRLYAIFGEFTPFPIIKEIMMALLPAYIKNAQ